MTTEELIKTLQYGDNSDLVIVRIGGAARLATLYSCRNLSWPDIYTIIDAATACAKKLATAIEAEDEPRLESQ